MVEARSLCPSHSCSGRMLTPASSEVVAKVCRNLCKNQLPQYGPSLHLFPYFEMQWPQLSPAL